jgi:hypothetical protein
MLQIIDPRIPASERRVSEKMPYRQLVDKVHPGRIGVTDRGYGKSAEYYA